MNRSHDADRAHRDELARLEDRVRDAGGPPSDPELAADWHLRRELAGLKPEPLSPELRRAVIARSRQPAGWRSWPVALAAGLAGVLVIATALQAPAPAPEPASTEELRLALTTIDRTSRRALGTAGREVGEHLRFPVIGLEQLPYGHLLRTLTVSTPQTHQPEEK